MTMSPIWKVVVAGCAVLALFAGCPSPATAQGFSLMSPEQEKQIGAEEHPKILAEYGGAYDDPALGGYVAEVAGRMVRVSDTPNAQFRVTLLNSPVVNAFALPGGYIYFTRGLLALANNEAELAGVIGHEIGHVTARHTAQRYSRGVMAQLGVAALDLLLQNSLASQLAQAGGALYLQKYSRDQEYQADLIGIQLLTRAGYAPQAQAHFLASLNSYAALENRIAGKEGAERRTDFMATHPRTADRVERAIKEAGAEGAEPIYRRDIFLDRIDGMVYGDDPSQGFVRGRTFSHPGMRITFTVPEGFRLNNGTDAVTAQGPNGAGIQFDNEGDRKALAAATSAADYLTRIWAAKASLQNVQGITINGLDAATATTRLNTDGGQADARLVAIRVAPDQIFRFTMISAPAQTRAMAEPYRQTAMSFRRLSPQEAAALKPLRIRIVKAVAGDTAEKFAARMAMADYRLDWFRVLNAIGPNDVIKPDQRVKLVVE
ncbi:MAG: M48 family metalloprotease [Alphaproteobacteria bacterium]|jgi:predicted Zn-dependent protease|nr:M48 family metalloprotease [Alphaproteobacteria bacterium]